jgi:hypothetical protein
MVAEVTAETKTADVRIATAEIRNPQPGIVRAAIVYQKDLVRVAVAA